jgi:hypothetical protein
MAYDLFFDLVFNGRIEPLSRSKADLDTRNGILKDKIAAHKLIKTEPPARDLIDEHIHVRAG